MSDSTALVVDASIVMKWYVPETGSREAVAVLKRGVPLLAPDLLAAEFGNILWKKVRGGELTADEAAAIAATFPTACPVTLVPALHLPEAAVEIALACGRTVDDALYVALAVARGSRLITADSRLHNALQQTALGGFVVLLPLS